MRVNKRTNAYKLALQYEANNYKTQNNKTLNKDQFRKTFNLIKNVNFRDNQDLNQDKRVILRTLRLKPGQKVIGLVMCLFFSYSQ